MLTNERKEKISAFLDDDMHRDELMSFSLSGEAEDAEVAQRYQMMGDALRGEMSDSSFIDVSAAVREAVSTEETYSITQSSRASDDARRHDERSSGLFSSLSSWLRPVSGMAVAASVAMVMVFTFSEDTATTPGLADNSQQSGERSAIQLAVDNKASKDQVEKDVAAAGQTQEDVPQLNPYLVNQHLEYATQDTMQGRLPLVRAVSYEADK